MPAGVRARAGWSRRHPSVVGVRVACRARRCLRRDCRASSTRRAARRRRLHAQRVAAWRTRAQPAHTGRRQRFATRGSSWSFRSFRGPAARRARGCCVDCRDDEGRVSRRNPSSRAWTVAWAAMDGAGAAKRDARGRSAAAAQKRPPPGGGGRVATGWRAGRRAGRARRAGREALRIAAARWGERGRRAACGRRGESVTRSRRPSRPAAPRAGSARLRGARRASSPHRTARDDSRLRRSG